MSNGENKGERSESYVVLKLVADGQLAEGDRELRPRGNNYYRLLKIILRALGKSGAAREHRREIVFPHAEKPETAPGGTNEKIFIRNGEQTLSESTNSEFRKIAEELLKEIRSKKDTGALAEFLRSKNLEGFVGKATCGHKSDLQLEILDSGTGTPRELGFSIKSYLGAAPTLVNASAATRLEFRLCRNRKTGSASAPDMAELAKKFNAMQDERAGARRKYNWCALLGFLREHDVRLEFSKCVEPIYETNLMTVDSAFPRVLATLVRNHFEFKKSSFADALEKLVADDPLDLRERFTEKISAANAAGKHNHNAGTEMPRIIYAGMMKRFLRHCVLGMNAGTLWHGKSEVSGGIIAVREDGNLVSFFAYNFDELDEFLFSNAKFETPSSTRHKFGRIVPADDGNGFVIRLIVQVRDRN